MKTSPEGFSYPDFDFLNSGGAKPKPKIYLSGSIASNGIIKSDNWKQTALHLEMQGFDVADPSRSGLSRHVHPADQIVSNDYNLIDKCHAIFIMADEPSWGAACEMIYAFQRYMPCVGVFSGDDPSCFLRYYTVLYKTTKNATDALRAYFQMDSLQGKIQ